LIENKSIIAIKISCLKSKLKIRRVTQISNK
jgi:hypothetical protein